MYIPDQSVFDYLVSTKVKIDENDCWNWNGNQSHNGYAQHGFRVGHKTYSVRMHVASYLIYIGEIEKEEIHHKCGNKLCINPNHLEDVTKETNTRFARGWTLNQDGTWNCKRGHHMVGDNLATQSSGHARCRTCQTMAVRAHKRGGSMKDYDK